MRLSPHHLVLALAALLALPAAAGDPKEAAPKKSDAAAPAMKIHVDPATGALLPEAPPAAKGALAAAPVESLPALKVMKVQAKAGGKMVKLDDRFMMDVTATAGPDGKVSQSCEVEHAKEARRER
jgi:hypothetical protein